MSATISNDISNDDIEQKVSNEIQSNANSKPLDFEEAEIVEEEVKQIKVVSPEMAFETSENGPGF
jgi:hypothetical protein